MWNRSFHNVKLKQRVLSNWVNGIVIADSLIFLMHLLLQEVDRFSWITITTTTTAIIIIIFNDLFLEEIF